MELNTWDLEFNNDINIDNLLNYITTTEKIDLGLLDINKESFNIIEKIVYDIALHHLNNLNLTFENNNIEIEFWIKNKFNYINQLHVDCDEQLRKENIFNHPLLSCVTYFEDSNYPFILTDINLEQYKYKNFDESKKLHLIFPRKYQHVTFNPIYYHGAINIFEDEINKNRSLLAINIWTKKLSTKTILNLNLDESYNKNNKIFLLNKTTKNNDYQLNEELFNFDFYESLLYNTYNIKQIFPKIIIEYLKDKINSNETSFTIINPKKPEEFDIIKYKTSIDNIENSKKNIYNILDMDKDNIVYNRFLQRFTFNKIYSPEICNWIINEAEQYAKNNGGWTTIRHELYPTTDIQVEKIKSICNFIFVSLENIFKKITKSYCLSNETNYNIKDLFIVKYNEQFQNELELHNDDSFLSFNLLLNHENDFEGGGTFFYDGIISYLQQGDMLVHSGKIKHSGIAITKGTRYVLVCFIMVDDYN
jgi:hypothetical protein